MVTIIYNRGTSTYSGTNTGTSTVYIDVNIAFSRYRAVEVKPNPKPDIKKKNKKFWHKFNSHRMDGKF